MKIVVRPAYGYGWHRDAGTIDVPPDFPLDVIILNPGQPFSDALGLVNQEGHVLSGLWVYLAQRTRGEQPSYNLSAFEEKPSDPSRGKAMVTGFALVEPISDQESIP